MTIEEFAAITRRVIAQGGFSDFQPTALFPARDHVALLSDLPTSADVETAALQWAYDQAREHEEVLLAFKVDDHRFRVVRRYGDVLEQGTFEAT